MSTDNQIQSVRQFRRFALAVCLVGVLVQLGLTAYYPGMGHRATPHDVPVGLVAPAAKRAPIADLLERDGKFAVRDYATVTDLQTGIKSCQVYGGVDATAAQPHLYLARRPRCCGR